MLDRILSPIHIYRVSRRLYLAGLTWPALLLKYINFLIFKALIPPQAEFGKRVMIMHQGIGLVVHPRTIIGDEVMIYHNVTLATDVWREDPARIVIGDRAIIYPHSIVVGPQCIGADAIVGAGSIVTKDVPQSAIVFGNPARLHRLRTGAELQKRI